jgi:two-component system, OmpR family, response regulator
MSVGNLITLDGCGLMNTSCGKILIVEDDENIRLIAGMCLEEEWRVIEAHSGLRALELAAETQPDVILLDVMMPGMDGVETLTLLRELHGLEQTPIIFMTAKVQTHEMETYVKLGAAGVIAKPFDPMSLSSEIRRIASQKGHRTECTTVC